MSESAKNLFSHNDFLKKFLVYLGIIASSATLFPYLFSEISDAYGLHPFIIPVFVYLAVALMAGLALLFFSKQSDDELYFGLRAVRDSFSICFMFFGVFYFIMPFDAQAENRMGPQGHFTPVAGLSSTFPAMTVPIGVDVNVDREIINGNLISRYLNQGSEDSIQFLLRSRQDSSWRVFSASNGRDVEIVSLGQPIIMEGQYGTLYLQENGTFAYWKHTGLGEETTDNFSVFLENSGGPTGVERPALALRIRVRIHSQNITRAANAHADRKTFGHRS